MRPRRIIAALLLLVASLAAAQTTVGKGQTVRRHREQASESAALVRAEAALDKKDYVTAEKTLRDLVAQDAGNYRAWFDLGYLCTAAGRQAEAIEAYRKSVAAKPDVFESNLNLGLMLVRTNDPEAETYLRAATRLKPSGNPEQGVARAWLSLGHVLTKKDPQQAIDAFSEAAKLQPKDSEPHLASAIVLEQQGDSDGAAKEYRQAAALDPKSTEAVAGLANVYMKAKRLPEAEAALRQYLALAPGNATAHVQLGRVLAAEGKNDEALAELETGLKAAPGDSDAIREIAALYDAGKKYDQAAAQYRVLAEKSPNDPELHRALGAALLHAHKPAEAQSELLAAIKLKPDFADAYSDLALAAADNNDYPLAIKALDARAKYLPENPGTYFLRATAYDHLRDYRRAAENYHQFLAVANGRYPDEEWKARHRLIAIEPKK